MKPETSKSAKDTPAVEGLPVVYIEGISNLNGMLSCRSELARDLVCLLKIYRLIWRYREQARSYRGLCLQCSYAQPIGTRGCSIARHCIGLRDCSFAYPASRKPEKANEPE